MNLDLIFSAVFISALIASVIRCKQIYQEWVPYAVVSVLCLTVIFGMTMVFFIVFDKANIL